MSVIQSGPAGQRPVSVMTAFERFLGWPSHIISAVFLIWLCWDARLPSLPWSVLGLYFFWAIFFLLWLAALFVTRSSGGSKSWQKWAITPAAIILGFVVSYSGIVNHATFAMNRPAFDRMAQQSLSSHSSPAFVRRIGPYRIEGVEYVAPGATQEAVYIYIAPFNRHVGFVYCPTCRPDPLFRRRNLGGGWYTFASYPA